MTAEPKARCAPFDSETNRIIVEALTEYALRTVGRERALAEQIAVTIPEKLEDGEMAIQQRDELLAALIAFRDGGPQGGKDFAEWHRSYDGAVALARAAIAKATGCAA